MQAAPCPGRLGAMQAARPAPPTWHQMKVLNTMEEMSSLAVSSAVFHSSSSWLY